MHVYLVYYKISYTFTYLYKNDGNHMLHEFNIITYYIGIYSGRSITGKTFSKSEYVSVVNSNHPADEYDNIR